MSEYLSFEEEAEIRDLLLGHRIVQADLAAHTFTLDSGTTVEVIPNEGGCACSAGDYELTHLATVDNIITDVRIVNDPSTDHEGGEGYRIFVVADATEINIMSVDGDDGNGYYGTGYSLHVKVSDQVIIPEEP